MMSPGMPGLLIYTAAHITDVHSNDEVVNVSRDTIKKYACTRNLDRTMERCASPVLFAC
jgi:hypothetical protein